MNTLERAAQLEYLLFNKQARFTGLRTTPTFELLRFYQLMRNITNSQSPLKRDPFLIKMQGKILQEYKRRKNERKKV